jgi:tricorn protease
MRSMRVWLLGIGFLFPPLIASGVAENPLWMRYPAVSPDGGTIVFSYRGDLYRVAADGGRAVPLTQHEAHDFHPVWSPDGRFIAFASDRYGHFDVFIISSEGGTPKRLTYYSGDAFPSGFSPDGKSVLYSSTVLDDPKNVQFPSGILSELYMVSVEGGRPKQVLSTPAESAVFDATGHKLLYHDRKGYENAWRKHHRSSVTRDVWLYDTETGEHRRLTTFEGEDRNPVLSRDGGTVFYLSEQFGDFNVCRFPLQRPDEVTQVTHHERHPVRFLTMADDGTLVYGYNGEIYRKKPGGEPMRVPIEVASDNKDNPVEFTTLTDGATEMAVSPDGREVAFVLRGEVFVTSVDYPTTKRVTNTPEQERSVSFSPDGRRLLYASERDDSWNIYETKLVRDGEEQFARSTLLEESVVLANDRETFQPRYSPDGKKVAFLEERNTLRVVDLDTEAIHTVVEGEYQYSYSYGEYWFDWSPDGKWFLVSLLAGQGWSHEDVFLVDAAGEEAPINLTKSGYSDANPKWMMKGEVMLWFSDRYGMRSHGSSDAERDVVGMFFTQEAYDSFRLTKEESEALEKREREDEEEETAAGGPEEDQVEPIEIDWTNLEDRKVRMTIHSSNLADAVLSSDGESLFYLSRFEKGHDLWVHQFKENETKLLVKLDGQGGSLAMDKEGNNLFVFSDGKIIKIDAKSHDKKDVAFEAEMNLDKPSERRYMFEHVWREVLKKFYDPQLHGVDWRFYKREYARFLPHINNDHDFAEMLSEMLGELNGSHTGARYRPDRKGGDETARLGAFFNPDHDGDGLEITEIMDKSPLLKADVGAKEGVIIEKMDGTAITADTNVHPLLNHKAGKPTLLSFFDPQTDRRWDSVVKPITIDEERQMLYERWVKNRREETERLSGGRIGYVHVRSMGDASFREAYSEIFGRNSKKEALVVDTRFNGGGWLHDELATLLSGMRYADLTPRGQHIGSETNYRWTKKSIVLVGEDNYSDAHGFPYAYRVQGIGKIVGMPVPGTMTAVWWERLQNRDLIFGIPQVGIRDIDGNYLENHQLVPDYVVRNDPGIVIQNRDQQLEKAVEVLLDELDRQ